MGTPLKNLSVLLSPKVLSPLSTISPKSPRYLSVPFRENINLQKPPLVHGARGLNNVAKKLEFSKPSPNSKFSFEPIKFTITEHSNTDTDNPKRDVVLNTPNKVDLIKNGLGENRYLNILGSGTFGKVIRGIYKDQTVAVKVVKSSASQRESNALNLHHRNIVRTIDITETKDENFSVIIMEYIPNSRQLQGLLQDPEIRLEDNIVSFAGQICEGVKFCHQNQILHLDVKPQNVLVCGNLCKLCDFGNSVKASDAASFNHQGTVPYTAPELLQGKPPTGKCDVYSLGVLFWQLRSRVCPYNDVDNIETVIYKVVKCNWRPERGTPADGYARLYQTCWSVDPEDRPSVSSVLEELLGLC